MVIFEIILFLFILLFVFFLPGRYTLRRFHIVPSDLPTTILLSFGFGISQYLIAIYILSWFKLEIAYYIFAVAASLLEARYTLKNLHKPYRFDTYARILIVTLVIGTVLMSYVMFRSGLYNTNGDLPFYGVNSVDAIWHLALIENLSQNFPPTHPGISDVPLRGYNFFYDLLLANIHKLYPISIMDLYFRYFAITFSLLFGIASIAFARFVKMSKTGVVLFLFLSYFAQGSGGYLLSLFNIPYNSPIVQSIAHAVDPNVLFSIILFYAGYILLFNKKTRYAAVLIFAVMPMVKIYTAILVFSGLGVISLVALLKDRNPGFLYILLTSAFLAGVLYLPINFGAGSLLFAPLLLYKHYMESGAVIPSYQWILKYQVYFEHGNFIRILQLYVIAILLFFIPSLGIRLVGIFSIKKVFTKKFYTFQHIFLLTAVTVGILIPSFFIQSVAVFVVVQFFWIVYILLLIPTAFTIAKMIGKVTVLKAGVTAIVLIGLFLPETVALLNTYSSPNPMMINANLVQAIQAIPSKTNDASILVLNEAFMNKDISGVNAVPIVSALSGKSAYYEPEVLEFLNGDLLTKNRKKTLQTIIHTLTECGDEEGTNQLLQRTNVSYILTYQPYSCLNTLSSVRKIHTSGIYSLYEVVAE